MADLMCDLRQSWRNACRAPLKALIIVASLAFGIGAVVTAFAVCDGLLLRPPPFAGADRYYFAGRVGRDANVEWRMDEDEFRFLREQARTIDGVTGHCFLYMAFGTGQEARYITGAFLPADVFGFLGIVPVRGRGFLPADDQPGAPDVCVISYEFWQREFGGSDQVVGRAITLDDAPRTVVGIAPPGTDFVRHADLWVPLKFDQLRRAVSWSRGATATVRLRAGITHAQAAAELELIGSQIQAAFPGKYPVPWKLQLSPNSSDSRRRTPELLVRYGSLLGVSVLVLVIACANVANLLLVEAARRNHELAVRSALGASRGRLIRGMLCESLILTGLATVIGVAGAAGLLDFLWTSLATWDEPNWMQFRISGMVAGGASLVAVLAGVGVGLIPAWRASRLDVVGQLKDGTRVGSSLKLGWTSQCLVALQVGLACAVLTAGVIAFGSLVGGTRLLRFDPDRFFMMRVQVRDTHYPTVADRARFFAQLLAEARAQPGIADAVATSRQLDNASGTQPVARAADRGVPLAQQSKTHHIVCTPGYFRALDVPVLRGREFVDDDIEGREQVCLVNTALAERLWGRRDPVGESILFDGRECRVVGLVPDLREEGFNAAPNAAGAACVYRPQGQAGFDFLSVLLRPQAGEVASALPAGLAALARVDSRVPVFESMPWGRQIEQGARFNRFLFRLSAGFGLGALLLAGVGVYAVVAFAVQLRAREIGIRLALGAEATDIFRLMARQGLLQIAAGLVLGIASGGAIAQLLTAVIHPFPAGILKYVVVLTAVSVVAALAIFLPTWRIARQAPVKLLS